MLNWLETTVTGSGVVESVKVYSNSKHPALTFVHETGHVIDYVFLRSSEKREAKQFVLEFLKSADGYVALQKSGILFDFKGNCQNE